MMSFLHKQRDSALERAFGGDNGSITASRRDVPRGATILLIFVLPRSTLPQGDHSDSPGFGEWGAWVQQLFTKTRRENPEKWFGLN